MPTAIDVMGFAGGFTLGMVQAGFTLVAKRELAGGFGVRNCETNRSLLGNHWDVEVSEHTNWTVKHADVVFGNPPCSGFSVMSRKDFRGADSPINHCMWAFANYVTRVVPQVAVFESVQQAYKRPDGVKLMRELRDYVSERTGHTYTLYHILHNAYSVGGVALRPRYFWLISRIPFGIKWPTFNKYPTFRDAVDDLSSLGRTWSRQPYKQPASWWAKDRRSLLGSVDGHAFKTNIGIIRIESLLRDIDWYEGEPVQPVLRRYYEKYKTLPVEYGDLTERIIKKNFFMGFISPTRWRYDAPARVITGSGPNMIVHPVQDRILTHREVARVLGFPDDWVIEPLADMAGLSSTWGKGITVDCGRWIGTQIKNAMSNDHTGGYKGEQVGYNEFLIDVTHAYKMDGPPRPKDERVEKKNVVKKEIRRMSEDGFVVPSEGATGRKHGRTHAAVSRDEFVLSVMPTETGITVGELTTLVNQKNAELPEPYAEFTSGLTYLSLYRLRKHNDAVELTRDGSSRKWFRKYESQ